MQSKRIMDMPGMMHLWELNNLYLAGQPTLETLDHLKDLGIAKVINLRAQNEMDFSAEVEKLKTLGIAYEQFPIMEEGKLSAANCERLSKQIKDDEKIFIHCATANRVGAWLMTYLIKYKGLEFEEALDIAMSSGLSNPALVDMVEEVLD